MSLSLCTWRDGHRSRHPSREGGGEDPGEEARAPSVGEKADGQPDQGLQDVGVMDEADGEHLLITDEQEGWRVGGAGCSRHQPHLQRTWG